MPGRSTYTLEPGHPTPGLHNLLRLPIASKRGIGLLTDFPSTTPFGLALGADSPCADERGAGNLGLSASGPFTRFIATHVSIRTSDTSSNPYRSPSQAYRTLSYRVSVPFNPLPISREPQSRGRAAWRVYAQSSRLLRVRDAAKATNLQLRRWVFHSIIAMSEEMS